MKINIIAIGKRMPAWVSEAFKTYLQRFPSEINITLKEIDAFKRGKNESSRMGVIKEGGLILSAIPAKHRAIALDERGKEMDTQALATRLQTLREQTPNISLLIGGADGLSSECFEKADEVWSLSKLTLPHPMVRVILIEQLYRAWTILTHHPYHRD